MTKPQTSNMADQMAVMVRCLRQEVPSCLAVVVCPNSVNIGMLFASARRVVRDHGGA